MNKTLNRLTTIFFFLLFFVLSPLLIFYAKGYRFDVDTRSIEKNGAFYIKSYPRGAEIFVDNIKNSKKTPTQLVDIKPDIHTVRVAKESYVPWEKKLTVYSGETTFAEDIVLFLELRPKEILGPGSDNYLKNKDNNQYTYIDDSNQLYLTDVNQARNIAIHQFDQDFELLDWSYDGQNLLLFDQKKYYIFNINRKSLDELNLALQDKIVWDNYNSDIFWLLNKNRLYKFNIKTDILPQVVDLNKNEYLINDFAIYNEHLILQYGLERNQFVEQIHKQGYDSQLILPNVTAGQLEILEANNDDLIFILGTDIYIKSQDKDLITIPVTNAHIHNQRILINSGHEIQLYNYKEDWRELIDRSSQIISDILWHPNGSYFLSEIDGKTKITEIDGRYTRNYVSLLEDNLKKLYLFNDKGDRLFVLTPKENFYLTIQ